MAETILLNGDLVGYVAERLLNDGEDLSPNIVVFPGRRPSHFLRKVLARRIKRSYIPPQIFSMDDFIDYLYERILQRREKKIGPLDGAGLLYRIKDEFAPNEMESLSPEGTISLLIRLFGDLEELHIEGVPPERLANLELVDYTVSERTRGMVSHISKAYRAFYNYLNKQGLSTRAMRYLRVSEEVELWLQKLRVKRLIIGGFFAFTLAEKRIINGLNRDDRVLFIFQEAKGIRVRLKELNLTYTEVSDENPVTDSSRVRIFSCPDTHGEVFTLRSNLQGLKERFSEDTAVVLPSSETLMPVLHVCLGDIQPERFNISMGYPLQRTPLFGFFNCLFEVIGSIRDDLIYLPDYLRFVLHPYTKNILYQGSPEGTRILFHEIESHLLSERRTFAGIEEIEVLPSKLPSLMYDAGPLTDHLIRIHDNTIRRLLDIRDVGEFVERLSWILLFIYRESTAPRHPYFHPFAEAFLKTFEDIKNSEIGNVSFTTRESYFNLFRKVVALQRVPFEGTPLRGLQVLGLLETRNLSFRRLFVLDCNEGILPPISHRESLLPAGARQVLGLPTQTDTEKIVAYYFDLLVRSSGEVNLFYVSGPNTQRSRFLESIIWKYQKDTGTLHLKEMMQTVEYRVQLSNPLPEEIEKDKGLANHLRQMVYTPSLIDQYLFCPLSFYYKEILGLGEAVPELEPDRTLIGTLVHRILRDFFRPLKGRVLTENDLSEERMHGLVEEHFMMAFGSRLRGRHYLIKRQVQRRLQELLRNYYHPLLKREEVITVAVEREYSLNFKGFKIRGTLDKVERRNGRDIIIDYKSSSRPDNFRINFKRLIPEDHRTWSSIGSLQIPIYLLLYRGNSSIKRHSGIYLLLGRLHMTGPIIEFDPLQTEPEALSLLEETLTHILGEVTDPSVPFYPAFDYKRRCPQCNFTTICGTLWVKRPLQFS